MRGRKRGRGGKNRERGEGRGNTEEGGERRRGRGNTEEEKGKQLEKGLKKWRGKREELERTGEIGKRRVRKEWGLEKGGRKRKMTLKS